MKLRSFLVALTLSVLSACGNLAQKESSAAHTAKQQLRQQACAQIELSSSHWSSAKSKHTLVCLLASHPQDNYDALLWDLQNLPASQFAELGRWLGDNYTHADKRDTFLAYVEKTPAIFGQLFLFEPFHKIIAHPSFASLVPLVPQLLKIFNREFSQSDLKQWVHFLSTYAESSLQRFRELNFSPAEIAEHKNSFQQSLAFIRSLSKQATENLLIHAQHILELAGQHPTLQSFIAHFARPLSCDIEGTQQIQVPLQEIILTAHKHRHQADVFQSYLLHTLGLWKDLCHFQDLSPGEKNSLHNTLSQNDVQVFLDLLYSEGLFFALAELGRHQIPTATLTLFSLFAKFSRELQPLHRDNSYWQAFIQGQGSLVVEKIILDPQFLASLAQHADAIVDLLFVTQQNLQTYPHDIEVATVVKQDFHPDNFKLWQKTVRLFLATPVIRTRVVAKL